MQSKVMLAILKILNFLSKIVFPSIAGQRLKKHPGEVGAGHHLWDHRLCHGGGQHHGHGLLQDGQAASDHLQLLSLQVFLLRCVSIKLQ